MKFLGIIKQIPLKLIVGLIWFYRKFISPLFPATCRFYPTCSKYSAEAFTRHGLIKGCWLTIVRILKCQPFYHGDPIDPVPPHKHEKSDIDG